MTRRNLLLAILLVSVAANLFFIGAIGYRSINLSQARESRPLPPNLGWLVHDLSTERRAELEGLLRAGAEDIQPLRREIFEAQNRVGELMSAEPFDGVALQQAFAELRDISDRYQEATQNQTVSILEQLTPEERQAARDFVRQRGPRDGRPGDGRPGPGGRPPPPPGAGPLPGPLPGQEPPQ